MAILKRSIVFIMPGLDMASLICVCYLISGVARMMTLIVMDMTVTATMQRCSILMMVIMMSTAMAELDGCVFVL